MPKDINSPQDNDNRNYDYTGIETENRKEYGVIANMITETGQCSILAVETAHSCSC